MMKHKYIMIDSHAHLALVNIDGSNLSAFLLFPHLPCNAFISTYVRKSYTDDEFIISIPTGGQYHLCIVYLHYICTYHHARIRNER